MLIAIMGESCVGKSTLASRLKDRLGAQVCAGKDYLRLAKHEAEAKALFRRKLHDAVTGENVIYVIAEREQLALLPDGCTRVLVTADLETIKARFAQRLGGNLPAPVAAMLERKHGCFDHEPRDYHVISGQTDIDAVIEQIIDGM